MRESAAQACKRGMHRRTMAQWRAGKLEQLERYCARDAEALAELVVRPWAEGARARWGGHGPRGSDCVDASTHSSGTRARKRGSEGGAGGDEGQQARQRTTGAAGAAAMVVERNRGSTARAGHGPGTAVPF